jgi:hypothetical protein
MTGRPEMTAATSATPQATSLYVYGVIPVADARGWPGTDGIDGPFATVRTLAARELAALVSALPSDRIPSRRDDLKAHRRVLSVANERGTTSRCGSAS